MKYTKHTKGFIMVKLKKYAKTALSVALSLLAIYFIFSAYKFITKTLERERDLLLA